jgi:hypothetical protein
MKEQGGGYHTAILERTGKQVRTVWRNHSQVLRHPLQLTKSQQNSNKIAEKSQGNRNKIFRSCDFSVILLRFVCNLVKTIVSWSGWRSTWNWEKKRENSVYCWILKVLKLVGLDDFIFEILEMRSASRPGVVPCVVPCSKLCFSFF